MDKSDAYKQPNVVAIIPAAGFASRLPGLNGSKEMIPVGTMVDPISHEIIPKPVCLYLLEKYRKAGITDCIIVLRENKKDIQEFFGSGERIGVNLQYQTIGQSCGTACTINQAHAEIKSAYVALGFPDILFSPEDGFGLILKKLKSMKVDVVLGLFPADRPEKVDMVDMSENQFVRNIIIKPEKTYLKLTWGIAVWRPSFTQFLYEYLSKLQRIEIGHEVHIGEVMNAAIHSGLSVVGEQVSNQPYLDIGTPDDLTRALEECLS